MPAAFHVDTGRAVSGTYPTCGAIIASTAVRGKLLSLTLGAYDTPADVSLKWILERFTAPGTLTAVTPMALDTTDDGAAQLTAGKAATAEPTYGGKIVGVLPLHQRQSAVFNLPVPAWIPRTSNNGIGVKVLAASATPTVCCGIIYEE